MSHLVGDASHRAVYNRNRCGDYRRGGGIGGRAEEKKREQSSAPGDEDVSRESATRERGGRQCIEFVIKDPGRCSRGLKGCFFRAENSLLSNGAPIQGHLNCPKGPCNML